MMSADSSLTKFIREQKSMLWRRLPFVALSVLMYFLYYIFGTVVLIQHERAIVDPNTALLAQSLSQRIAEAVSAHAGVRGIGSGIGFTGAMILGIQSFSYLYKAQTVDFYESRPEKRSVRFFNIIFNSFLIYAIPSLICAVLSFFIAAASGAAYMTLFGDIMLAWVLNSVMFLASYGMSAFASLLTGTVVTALFMNFFVFGLEMLVRMTVFGYRAAYYATFDSDNEIKLIAGLKSLPPYNLIKSYVEAKMFGGFDAAGEYIVKALPELMKGCGINLVIAVISFVLAFIAYKYRRAEDAGKAVVNPYISVFIKYCAGILFALDTGLLIYWIFGRQGSISLPAVILTMITTVIVTCLILEAIFALNVRSALKRVYDMPVILVISLIILFIFKMDVFGYDKWLPSASGVESAWLCNNSYDIGIDGGYYDETNYIGAREFAEKNMFITDIEDMLVIAEKGQAAKVENAVEYGIENEYAANGYWNATVGWRMKSGKTVTRNVAIPEDIDAAVMDRIVGSEEFIKGVYLLDDPDYIIDRVDEIAPGSELVLSTTSEHGNLTGDGRLLNGFLAAYTKDLSANYDFTMASYNVPVGLVSFYTDNTFVSGYTGYFQTSWPIYDSYKESIAYLEENGLWNGGSLEKSEVEKIVVTTYNYTGEMSVSDDPVTYTDRKDIEKIMDSSLPTTYYSAWGRYYQFEHDGNKDYSIEVYPAPDTVEDMEPGTYYYRQLLKDKELPEKPL